MKHFKTTFVAILFASLYSYSQNIQDLIDLVDLNRLTVTLEEFTGEQSAMVNGNSVSLVDRRWFTNDDAADYLVERLGMLDNITILDQAFNSSGRNIVATQLGQTNPNDIYIICAHYDGVDDYAADDNGTGVVAVLEVARILSTQCLDNTIIYAFWDEEEIGLNGSEFYADQAAANGDNILQVLNLDMMGYDGDAPGTTGDNDFDIDVRNIGNSIAMKDEIINVLNSYTFDLNVVVVDPGYYFSDHGPFWDNGYTGLLLGESWETADQSPFYHTANDRVSTLDLQYFHELTKLVTAYMATKGSLVSVDNTITQTATTLSSNQSAATYQWINCETDMPISGATSQTYMPVVNGIYAVEVTISGCTERSDCVQFDTLSLDAFSKNEILVYPIPVKSELNIEFINLESDAELKLYDLSGKILLTKEAKSSITSLNMQELPQGIYFLNIENSNKSGTYKIVKE
ncbi:M28 family peptidase [Psychroserpens sp.]|uniref:M28 family peptidase n=1 Tax=Psychroserpens sp. TaxID=2020870 RepID=UPI001B07902A|nr:M28 family peptidase [Psychroserpens sp.]MBO6605727.1 M28 family peptidase [Psychroserpens sp.]MBO6630307.1 M28 family peptidase [Psychroserpens sp.]MBO6652902.1 M28 family peptidase [Psychroserpens sp.]MBO6681326.1 M28 family peptidase [Psychroserpens sp.]MBO6749101.1 M28 family peptidase [Psychroserpens sp.]